jgi:hypothetical protein
MNLKHIKSMAPYFELHYDMDRGTYVVIEAGFEEEGRPEVTCQADENCEYPGWFKKYLVRAGIEPWLGQWRARVLSEMRPAQRRAAIKKWGWNREEA